MAEADEQQITEENLITIGTLSYRSESDPVPNSGTPVVSKDPLATLQNDGMIPPNIEVIRFMKEVCAYHECSTGLTKKCDYVVCDPCFKKIQSTEGGTTSSRNSRSSSSRATVKRARKNSGCSLNKCQDGQCHIYGLTGRPVSYLGTSQTTPEKCSECNLHFLTE